MGSRANERPASQARIISMGSRARCRKGGGKGNRQGSQAEAGGVIRTEGHKQRSGSQDQRIASNGVIRAAARALGRGESQAEA